MTINISSGSSGWGNYVLYGTAEKPRDSNLIEELEGDIALGDKLCESNKYEESYYKIVLAFEGKPDKEVLMSAYDDFKKEFFVGFKKDEYHIDSVIHKDTDNYHIHCRVPKQNLKTDTHLQLYMDKIDRPRKQLIQDHISLKYGFSIAREQNREIFKEEAHEHINKWREQHNQKPFDFSNKKGKEEAEKQINTYISDLTTSGLISSNKDVKSTLEELGIKVEKFGTDLKKDFSYVTVSNETGKMRVKGEIYNDKFWEHSREDRATQIEDNQRIISEREPNIDRIKTVRAELNKANERRFKKVTELFKPARTRAEAEHKQTLEVGRLESISNSKSNKLDNRDISDNTNSKSEQFKEASKLHREPNFQSDGRKEISTIQPKRANLRQTKTSLLLQNRLKEKQYDKHTREAIERTRSTREAQSKFIQSITTIREAQSRALQSIRSTREAIYRGAREVKEVALKAMEKIRESMKNTKETFMDRLKKVDSKFEKEKDFGKLEKSEQMEKFIKNMEVGKPVRSEASSLNKPEVKEVKEVDLSRFREGQKREQEKVKDIAITEVKELVKAPKRATKGRSR